MTEDKDRNETPQGQAAGEHGDYVTHAKSIGSWLFSLDHKRIGILYAVTVAIAFLLGGVFALLVRAELLSPGEDFLSAQSYNQMFSLHGIVMVFGFIIPAIPGFLGNFLLPLHLGAKDVAFPRLNLASYYLYLLGVVLILVAMVAGSVDTGWTFYTPYSARTGPSVLFLTMAVFIAGFASIFTGINFIVTVHKMRAPGMTWNRLPLFVWSIYSTSIVQVLATPVLGITVLLLFLERLLHIGIFDPALGGDPILFQHFFWFYSHPAVYIMILPGFGIVSELIATFSRQRIYGYMAIALSSVAIALLGFLVWGHHMFVAGQSVVSSVIFSLITYLIGIPSGIKVFNWIATMYKGSISFKTPMLYALSFLVLFTIGGVTGIMVGVLAVDVHLHDTYYVVGHFHYVMVGGTTIALLGGLHYWWPKITGRLYNETAGRLAALLVFVGLNLTFFTQLVMGSRGMPRRYNDYLPEFTFLHQLSTVGSWIMGAGLFLVAIYLLASLFRGKKAGANPWGGATLEWTHTGPRPDPHNFHRTPFVTRGPYEFDRIPELVAAHRDETSADAPPDVHLNQDRT